MTKKQLPQFILNALNALNGEASIGQICKHIWMKEISRMPESDRDYLFYTWGYDVRWAGQTLRDNNQIHIPRRGVWALGGKTKRAINNSYPLATRAVSFSVVQHVENGYWENDGDTTVESIKEFFDSFSK